MTKSAGRDFVTARLDELRKGIEEVDGEILKALVARARLAEAIGRTKEEAGLPVLDPAREARVVSRASKVARDEGLPIEDVRALYWRIIELCRHAQMEEKSAKGGRGARPAPRRDVP